MKAKLDGEYVNNISFEMDVKCFFGTIVSVLGHEGVVEGGTGTLTNGLKPINFKINKESSEI